MTNGILQRLPGITISTEEYKQVCAKDSVSRLISKKKKASDPKVQRLGKVGLYMWLSVIM